MRFLIDEDLSRGIAKVFSDRGFDIQRVVQINELRGKPDEVIFEYARVHGMVIVTADLGFPNPQRFSLHELPAMILLRFPNEMSDSAICLEVQQRLVAISEQDLETHLIVIEPGLIRVRPLAQF